MRENIFKSEYVPSLDHELLVEKFLDAVSSDISIPSEMLRAASTIDKRRAKLNALRFCGQTIGLYQASKFPVGWCPDDVIAVAKQAALDPPPPEITGTGRRRRLRIDKKRKLKREASLLREQGYSYSEISIALDISVSTAHRWQMYES